MIQYYVIIASTIAIIMGAYVAYDYYQLRKEEQEIEFYIDQLEETKNRKKSTARKAHTTKTR